MTACHPKQSLALGKGDGEKYPKAADDSETGNGLGRWETANYSAATRMDF
jgi:hypothetical protein